MKNSFYILFMSLVFLSFGIVVKAQETRHGQVSVRLDSGLTAIFTTETDPPGSQLTGSIQMMSGSNVIHRAFIDSKRGVFFGYDVLIESLDQSDQVKLTFKPLSIPPSRPLVPPTPTGRGSWAGGGRPQQNNNQQTELPTEPKVPNYPEPQVVQRDDLRSLDVLVNQQAKALTELKLPKYPEPQIVQRGDTLALDVLVNPQTGVKVIDMVKITTSSGNQTTVSSGSGYARATSTTTVTTASNNQTASTGGSLTANDFTVDAVELKMTSSQLLLNGEKIFGGERDNRLGVKGALIWFYLADKGRFILSLTPRPGYDFQKIGTIENNRIIFTIKNDTYEWISDAPIVAGTDGRWNLWVLHEPGFRSGVVFGQSSRYLIGASNIADYTQKKK
jgi:hypothetical protein